MRTLGAGPTLVLLPGLGRSGHDLDAFAARLVDAGYRTVLPEPRGIGGSTGSLDGITLHDLARDIAAVIETLCDGPVVVIGHAFGNRIARCLAADRPALVDLVVLLSSSGKVQPTPEIAEAIRLAQAIDMPADIRAEVGARGVVRTWRRHRALARRLVAAGDARLSRRCRGDAGGRVVDRRIG